MTIKTVQWNIGGGKIRTLESNPEQAQSYSIDGIGTITELLRKYLPDIVTLQETHANDHLTQAKELARRLNLPFYFNDVYDKSHIEPGQGLGQAILSRFPLTNHSFSFFVNPHYGVTRPGGEKWVSHDKGLTSAVAELPNSEKLVVATLHLIPFKRFGIDPTGETNKLVRDDIATKVAAVSKTDRFLLQGDFNFDNPSLRPFLAEIFTPNVEEIKTEAGTTPKGRRYDHIVYKGLTLRGSDIKGESLTDHFPIFAEFEV